MAETWTRGLTSSLLLLAAVVACAPERQAPSLPQNGTASATRMLGTLEARLSVQARAKKGAPFTLSVDLVNRGDSAAKLDAPGDDVPFDVIVTKMAGDTIWVAPPPGSARDGTLRENPPIAPGGSQAYGAAGWDQRDLGGRQVTAGSYNVTVVLYADAPWGIVQIGPVRITIDP